MVTWKLPQPKPQLWSSSHSAREIVTPCTVALILKVMKCLVVSATAAAAADTVVPLDIRHSRQEAGVDLWEATLGDTPCQDPTK